MPNASIMHVAIINILGGGGWRKGGRRGMFQFTVVENLETFTILISSKWAYFLKF